MGQAVYEIQGALREADPAIRPLPSPPRKGEGAGRVERVHIGCDALTLYRTVIYLANLELLTFVNKVNEGNDDMTRMKKCLLTAVLALVALGSVPSLKAADVTVRDYWPNYWGWYDNNYSPYYRRYYNRNDYYQPRYNYYRGYDRYYEPGPRFGVGAGPLYFEWR
jgi:hypothetical protein